MAVEVVKIVDPDDGAGADYTSLSAWEAGEQRDLVSADEIAVAKCRCTGGSADTTAVSIYGWTTSSGCYIRIWTDPDEDYRHDGKWNTNKYRLEVGNNSCIIIQEHYVRIDGLQIELTTSTERYAIWLKPDGSSDVRISNTIIKGVVSGGSWVTGINTWGSSNDAVLKCWNNIIYGFNGYGGAGIGNYNGILYAYNNTVSDCRMGIRNYDPYDAVTHAVNNAVFNNDDDFSGSFFTCDYNASDDVDGTNAVDISPGANEEDDWNDAFVDYANGDFHIKNADSVLCNAGTNDPGSGLYSDDIDGDARSGTWDIGADEYIGVNESSFGIAWKLLTEISKELLWAVSASTDVDVSWKLFSGKDVDSVWKILDSFDVGVAWKLLNTSEVDLQWKIFEKLDRDVAWQILTAGVVSKILEWKILAAQDIDSAWKLLNTSEIDSQWKILNESGLSSAWRLLAQFDEATAWKILSGFDKEVAWKLLLSKGRDVSWQILVSNVISTAWKILGRVGKDSSWKILNEIWEVVSWRILDGVGRDTCWKILDEVGKDTSWRILNELGKDSCWKILNGIWKDASWRILEAVEKDTSWRLLTSKDNLTAWKLLTGLDATSAWRLLSEFSQQSSWKILTSEDRTLSWQIFSLYILSRDLAWKLFNQLNRDVLWRILQSWANDVGWSILGQKDLDLAWELEAERIICRAILLESEIRREVMLKGGVTREIFLDSKIRFGS